MKRKEEVIEGTREGVKLIPKIDLSSKSPLELISDMTLKKLPAYASKLEEALEDTSFRGKPSHVTDIKDEEIKFKYILIKNGSCRILLNIQKELFELDKFRDERNVIDAIDAVRQAFWKEFKDKKTWNRILYIIRPQAITIHKSVYYLINNIWKDMDVTAKLIEITVFNDKKVLRAALDIAKEKKKAESQIEERCLKFIKELKEVPRKEDLRPINEDFHKFNLLLGEVLGQFEIDEDLYMDLISLQNQISVLIEQIEQCKFIMDRTGVMQATSTVKTLLVIKVLPKIKQIMKQCNDFESRAKEVKRVVDNS